MGAILITSNKRGYENLSIKRIYFEVLERLVAKNIFLKVVYSSQSNAHVKERWRELKQYFQANEDIYICFAGHQKRANKQWFHFLISTMSWVIRSKLLDYAIQNLRAGDTIGFRK